MDNNLTVDGDLTVGGDLTMDGVFTAEHVTSNTSEFAYIEATEELVIPSSAPDTPTVGDIYLDNTNNELRIRTSNGLYKVTLTPVQ